MQPLEWVPVGLYGLFTTVATLNLLAMKRPARSGSTTVQLLIPARNEESNLQRLLPQLQGAPILVYDDGSTDQTAEVAREAGATVIRGGALPEGWTGKNHACHRLAQIAAETSDAEWWVFLDADLYPEPTFIQALSASLHHSRAPVVTGFPRGLPGQGIEPLFLAWVGWILLATNPFGLVNITGMGHNAFLNGQIVAVRARTYTDHWPHQKVKDRILEDVLIGRYFAKRRVKVEVLNWSRVLSVRMYETWHQALDGMSKNSYEIAGSAPGTVALALLMLVVAWAWVLLPWSFGLLLLSGLLTALTMRYPLWFLPFLPISLSIGAFTLMRSLVWHRQGRVTWKGRTYSAAPTSASRDD